LILRVPDGVVPDACARVAGAEWLTPSRQSAKSIPSFGAQRQCRLTLRLRRKKFITLLALWRLGVSKSNPHTAAPHHGFAS
jgi:hypothetical protein